MKSINQSKNATIKIDKIESLPKGRSPILRGVVLHDISFGVIPSVALFPFWFRNLIKQGNKKQHP